MAALPTVGGSNNTWGSDLNAWALTNHTNAGFHIDGTAFGTNPASAGTIRMPNNSWIAGRNAANSADVNIVKLNGVNYLEFGAPLVKDSFGLEGTANWDDQGAFIRMRRRFTNLTASANTLLSLHGYASGTTTVTDRSNGLYVVMEDDVAAGVTSVRNKTITNMTRVGTTVTVTATAHGFANGDRVAIYGVLHTFNAQVNGAWTVANQAANTFDITVAALSSGTYTSGGTVTNRPMMYGIAAYINPTQARGLLTGTAQNGDDLAAYVAYNGGTQRGTDCVYLGSNATNFNRTVSNAVTHGGLIQLTATAHGCVTGEAVIVQSVGGIPNADGKWTVTVIDANTLDLQGSTFGGAYTSGGTVYRPEWWSVVNVGMNAVTAMKLPGSYSDFGIEMSGIFAGPGMAFDGRYNQSAIQVTGVVTSGAVVNVSGATVTGSGIRLGGTYTTYGILLDGTYTLGAIRLPNNVSIVGRNNAGSADVTLIKVNTLDELSIDAISRINANVTVAAGVNFTFATSTGTKLGTNANNLIGFHNATPVVQHATTGETVGFTAGGGTTVTDASTFTGNVGSTAYRISDIVKALKNKGLMAS